MASKISNLLELANSEMSANRYEEAISFYNKALEIDTKSSIVWEQKAIAVFKSSTLGNCRFPESIAFFENAIKYSSNTQQKEKEIVAIIIQLVEDYFPSYEIFYKEHYLASSSIDSLLSAYLKFDTVIYWAAQIDKTNEQVFLLGYDMCRNIIEMPEKSLTDKVFSAFGKEMAGKLIKDYRTESSGRIDKEIAAENRKRFQNFKNNLFKLGKKYEDGIGGISDLKILLKHGNIIASKPNLSSEGKDFESWLAEQRKSNQYSFIIGVAFIGIGSYNLSANGMTFWTFLWFLIALILSSRFFWNKPTGEKYSLQQDQLKTWIESSKKYIADNKVTKGELNKLYSNSNKFYKSYIFFNSGKAVLEPKVITEKFDEYFFSTDNIETKLKNNSKKEDISNNDVVVNEDSEIKFGGNNFGGNFKLYFLIISILLIVGIYLFSTNYFSKRDVSIKTRDSTQLSDTSFSKEENSNNNFGEVIFDYESINFYTKENLKAINDLNLPADSIEKYKDKLIEFGGENYSNVMDFAENFAPNQVDSLNSKITQINNNYGIEIQIVTLYPFMYNELNTFSLNLAKKWRPGHNLNGYGILIAMDGINGKIQIQNTISISKIYSDKETKGVLTSKFIPNLKNDLYEGIKSGMMSMVEEIVNKPDFIYPAETN